MKRRTAWLATPLPLVLLLWLASLLLAADKITQYGGLLPGLHTLFSPLMVDAQAVILHSMWLPRQAMALLCGAMLALCGGLMQRALNNPLAEPMTLGITSGAVLAMGCVGLLFPYWLLKAQTLVVLAGELLALGLVVLLAWRQRLSPISLIQAGMLVNLWCGSLTLLMAIINDRFLLSVLMWGGGSLVQQDWHSFIRLAPEMLVCLLLLLLILRPLELLKLPEQMVSSLGASPLLIRSGAVLLSLLISALMINTVGVIGFVGLAAPHLAKLCGARTARQSLLWSPLIGAGLLWLTDLAIANVSQSNGQLMPVGMMTALAGGPLLMLLASKVRPSLVLPDSTPVQEESSKHSFKPRHALLLLPVAIVASLFIGDSVQGWHWASLSEMQHLLPLRLPRLLAALSAGALLAAAGVLMQRLSGNPLASPEVLGIGGGASMGLTLFVISVPNGSLLLMVLCSALGALLSLMFSLWNSRRSAFNPQRILLNGLALNALFQAVASMVMLNNPQATSILLQLMTGSTYYVNAGVANGVFIATLLLLAMLPLFKRWLALLPLGGVASSLGVTVSRARLWLLVFAALMTALATLIVGPVSFVGLLGPHLARKAGATRPLPQLFTAVVISALIMVCADWMGRNFLYPRQIPAGLVAGLIGVPLLVWPLLRSRASKTP